jgi:DNA-directed RNA polymerase subunit RPC12/RpoP
MFCSKCGKEIPDDSVFCSFCGSKVIIIPKQSIKESTKKSTVDSIVEHIWDKVPPYYIIDQDLSICIDFLRYKGKKYLFSDIKSLRFSRFLRTLNGLPTDHRTTFSIILDNDQTIDYDIKKIFFRGEKSSLLETGYNYLQKNTFSIRLNKIIETMNKKGFVELPSTPVVRLYIDGTIEDKNGRRLKLKGSIIDVGEYYVNYSSSGNIRVSDKPRPFLTFFESENTIEFKLNQNRDVFLSLIKSMVKKE